MILRWWIPGLLAVLLVGCRPDKPGATPLATWRSPGGSNLIAQASGAPLGRVTALPASAAMFERWVDRIAARLAAESGETNAAAVLRPVVADLLRRESAGDVTSDGWWVAVRGDASIASAWGPALPVLARFGGASSAGTPREAPALVVTNGWVIASGGSVDPASRRAALDRDPAGGLEASLDLSRWGGGLGVDSLRLKVSGGITNGIVRWEARVVTDRPWWGDMEAWAYPTNQIRDPLVMFTAARGVRPVLGRIPWLARALGSDLPNQFVAWSQARVPFRNWMAAPVDGDSKAVRRIHDALLPWFGPDAGTNRAVSGRLAIATNEMAAAILLGQRLEAITPAVGLLKDGGRTFLQASLFAPEPGTNLMPAELGQQIAPDSIAFYQYEMTGAVAMNLHSTLQLGRILLGQRPSPTNAPAQTWMIAALPELGEAVTRAEVVGPAELGISRKSSLGLAAAELVALVRWLDGPPGRPSIRPQALLPGNSGDSNP